MKSYKELIPEFETAVKNGERINFPFIVHTYGQYLAGIKSDIYYNDPDTNVEISLLTAEYFGLSVGGGNGCWDLYNFEARAMGQTVQTAEFGLPDIDYNHPLCKTEEDLEKIKWEKDDPFECGRLPLIVKGSELMEKYTGKPTTSVTCACSPFTLACEIFSFAGFMKIIKKKPDFAHQILDKIIYDVEIPLYKAIAKRYPGVICKCSDAWDMIPNISPKIEREYVWPSFDKIQEAVKDLDIKVGWWCTYGESQMPDPDKYMEEKSKYNGAVSCMNREGMPGSFYRDNANRLGLRLMTWIPNEIVTSGPEEKIVEYIRNIAKTQRCGTDKFFWQAGVDPGTPLENAETALAAMKAFSVLPCPTPEEMDKIVVIPERHTESFGDFCRRHAKENPNGYTFKWLDQARFIGE
jgi:hypothetical protein